MKTNKGIVHLFLLIIVIFVAIGAIGYLAYKNGQLKKQGDTTTTPESTEQQVGELTESLEMDFWQSYTNTKYNFSFKIPPSFEVPESEIDFGKIGDKIEFSVSDTNPLNCIGDCPIIESSEKVGVNGLSSTKIEGYTGEIGGCVSRKYISYFFPHNNEFITVTLYASACKDYDMERNGSVEVKDVYRRLLNQILSTFRFMDESDETADWKTYTNTRYNFSFKYPSYYLFNASYSVTPEDAYSIDLFTPDIKGPPGGNPSKEYISISIYIDIYKPQEKFNNLSSELSERIYIDGIEALRGEVYNGFPPEKSCDLNPSECQIRTVIFKNNRLYSISATPANSYLLYIHNQFLSTFKFTE